ncbi:MAG: M23 family metallopeptidase, partial [Oscillospiraceae bacterium]|nr:M23 family metallopeptidase [Oscillospiraceae bacterium]
ADDDSEVFTPTPTFKLVFGTDDNLDDEYALCDKIIKNSGSSITEADGLYVDGKFYGATEDGQTLQRALDNILAENSSGKENERVSFVQEVEIKQGIYPVKSVSSISEMTELLHSEVEGEKLYTVQRGDTPYAIASMNGIKLAELTALNPGITKSLLPGQQVLVSQAVPFLSTKTIVTETYEEKISYKSTQIEDSTKYRGVASVVQYGKNGKQKVTADVTYIDGVEVERNILSTEVLVEPVNQITKVGTKLPVSLGKNQSVSSTYGTGKFMWPAAGGYVSCGFYGYRGHTGMDIAVPTGTPIYASDTGVVVVARNSYYGYGRYIKIDHGSNVQTLYAHNYKLLVKVGDVVKKGDLIAYSGSTGNSSGPHLHFEVIINGSYKNPANYVSRY